MASPLPKLRRVTLVLAAQFLVGRLLSRFGPTPPPWRHRPPDGLHERAELCGAPECDNPVGEHASGEWCSNVCYAKWITAQPVSERNQEPFFAPDISPEPPPEPPWMARLTAYEKAKAVRVIAERKSPTTSEEAA